MFSDFFCHECCASRETPVAVEDPGLPLAISMKETNATPPSPSPQTYNPSKPKCEMEWEVESEGVSRTQEKSSSLKYILANTKYSEDNVNFRGR